MNTTLIKNNNPKKRFTFYVLRSTFIILAILTIVVIPLFTSAQSIVPCGNLADPNTGVVSNPCTFNDFIITVGRIVNGIIIIISAWAAVSFMYAGYAYLTSGGNQEKVSYAKGIFWKVFLGYIIILGAWAFIHMIEITLMANTNSPSDTTNPGTSFLQKTN